MLQGELALETVAKVFMSQAGMVRCRSRGPAMLSARPGVNAGRAVAFDPIGMYISLTNEMTKS